MGERNQVRLEETKRHGSVLFPFNIYPCTIPADFPTVALHWHRSMELIYVKKGSGQVQMGLETLVARADDIFILPPGTLHALRRLPGRSMEYENIIFDPDFLGAGAVDVCARQYLIPLSGGQLLHPLRLRPGAETYESVAVCLQFAERLCTDCSPGYELGVKAAMLELLFHLIRRQPAPSAAESPGSARLKQVLQRIQENYAQPLRIEQMAADCGLSPSHFMRWFRQTTGSSFTAYLNEYRLAAAAERLQVTNDKILAVAQETGFETLSNFNRQFKARYGMTPREYRQPERRENSPAG